MRVLRVLLFCLLFSVPAWAVAPRHSCGIGRVAQELDRRAQMQAWESVTLPNGTLISVLDVSPEAYISVKLDGDEIRNVGPGRYAAKVISIHGEKRALEVDVELTAEINGKRRNFFYTLRGHALGSVRHSDRSQVRFAEQITSEYRAARRLSEPEEAVREHGIAIQRQQARPNGTMSIAFSNGSEIATDAKTRFAWWVSQKGGGTSLMIPIPSVRDMKKRLADGIPNVVKGHRYVHEPSSKTVRVYSTQGKLLGEFPSQWVPQQTAPVKISANYNMTQARPFNAVEDFNPEMAAEVMHQVEPATLVSDVQEGRHFKMQLSDQSVLEGSLDDGSVSILVEGKESQKVVVPREFIRSQGARQVVVGSSVVTRDQKGFYRVFDHESHLVLTVPGGLIQQFVRYGSQ